LIVLEQVSENEPRWLAYNKGNGPALHLYWKIGITNEKQGWYKLGALAVNDWSDLPDQSGARLLVMPENGLRVHYSDLAGNKYCTVMENGSLAFQQDSFELSKSECCHLTKGGWPIYKTQPFYRSR
jgi:hypothetical protein